MRTTTDRRSRPTRQACVAHDHLWTWVQPATRSSSPGRSQSAVCCRTRRGRSCSSSTSADSCGRSTNTSAQIAGRRRPARACDYTRHVDRDQPAWEPWPPVIRLELKIDGLNAATRTPVQGRDDVAADGLLADGRMLRRLILHPRTKGWVSARDGRIVDPSARPRATARHRPNPRRARRAAADHAGAHPDISPAAALERPSLSPPPAPNRARAGARSGPPSADEQRKHLRRRRSCVTSPPRHCRET